MKRSISMNSEPILNNNDNPITPPNNSIHSSNLNHPSLNDDNEQINKILDIKLKNDTKDFEDLNTFCYNIIQQKFKEGIRLNSVLPSESDKKTFKLKIYQQTNPLEIKENIISTINNPDPKIIGFIHSTIDLILLDQMKIMERSFVSLHNKTFTKIFFNSTFKQKIFSSNYYSIDINLLSINFL